MVSSSSFVNHEDKQWLINSSIESVEAEADLHNLFFSSLIMNGKFCAEGSLT